MSAKIVYVIGTAAPPIFDWPALFEMLRQHGWQPHPVLSPIAASWCELDPINTAAGIDARVDLRLPTESDPWPNADAVLAAPLTFNTVNKWAGGTNDTLVLGLLNELMGARVPIVAAPCAKTILQSHPAYTASLKLLSDCGVNFLDQTTTIVRDPDGRANFDWPVLVNALPRP